MKRFIALALGLIGLILLVACTNDTSDTEGEWSNLLSELHTPYIGSAPSVSRIVRALPLPGEGWMQRFFTMGTNAEPYTLTVFYEPDGLLGSERMLEAAEKPIKAFQANALVLFALIDNLNEVTFAVRYTPSPDSVDENDYDYFWATSRSEISAMFGVSDWGELLDVFTHMHDLLNMQVLFPLAISTEIEMQDTDFSYQHENFSINIAPARDDLLVAFGHLYEFDYYDIYGTSGGDSFVIWADAPLSDVWLISFYPDFETDELVHVLNRTHFITETLMQGQAIVIRNYMGRGTFPWSGVTFFTHTSERQYYFAQDHNRSDTPNRFAIWPIDVSVQLSSNAEEGIPIFFNNLGFGLTFPAFWDGKFSINESYAEMDFGTRHFVEVYHTATREEGGFGGTIFVLGVSPQMHYSHDGELPIMAGGTIILAQTGGNTYFVNFPSGVEHSEAPNSETAAEYLDMVGHFEPSHWDFLLHSFRTYP